MSFKIQRFLRDEIVIIQLEKFLKDLEIPTAKYRGRLVEHFENCVNDEECILNAAEAENFLVNTIKYGNRRFLYITKFRKSDQNKLKNYIHVLNSIKSLDTKIENPINFNLLNSIETNTLANNKFEVDRIEYLHIEKDKQNKSVEKIEICITRFERNEDPKSKEITDSKNFVWIEIDVLENIICFRVPSSGIQFGEYHQSNKMFVHYYELIRDTFEISFEEMHIFKETLYNIAKDVFEVAERPFLERFQKANESIEKMLKLAERRTLFQNKSSLSLFSGRLEDLIQRVIIQENFDEYMGHGEGKDGIITKIEFTDPTGASVRAHAGTKTDETLEVCDIFFDTRKTLSENSTIDQLLIDWFIPNDIVNNGKVTCKFFSGVRYIAINFQFIKLSREVESYVFSKLRKYNGFEWYK